MARNALFVGGTDMQGAAVVRALCSRGSYNVTVLTRKTMSEQAVSLSARRNVSIINGDGYHEPSLSSALKGVGYCFVNIDGFAIGEAAEVYWGIRIFELAREAGVRHFVYGGLHYMSKKAGYVPNFRCGT